jgi:phage I-like protein
VDLVTLADLPELKGTDPAPKATITVARLDDKLYDPRYGNFKITQDDVDGWKRNLSQVFGGRVSIDEDHSSDRGKGTKAVAWITGLSQQGRDVKAAVEFTPSGAQKIRDKEYLYISPTFVANYRDEHKVDHGKALLGAAVTNRPVLRKDMPTLSLSRDTFAGVATTGKRGRKKQRNARRHARTVLLSLAGDESSTAPARLSDSRRRMDLKTLAKQLGLAEDADQATILAAVAQLPEQTTTDPTPVATAKPVQLSKDERKAAKKAKKAKKASAALTLSADDLAGLITNANAGQAAAAHLAETRFTSEWTKTLDEGRVAPDQEETFRALFAENSELAIKTLSGLQRIVPTIPRGDGTSPGPAGDAPAGVDPERYQLHLDATNRAKELARQDTSLTPDEAYALAAVQLDDEHTAQAARGY